MESRDSQPDFPRPYGVIEAERRVAEMLARRDEAIIAEHERAEHAALDQLLAPDITIVSVAEVEQLVLEMEDNPPAFCARMAVMRRQLKRNADAIQGLNALATRLERAEETLDRMRLWEAV